MGIVERAEKRGSWRVNPIYFFKGTEGERIKVIREDLEEPYTTIIKYQRHEKLKKRNNER